MTTSYPSAKTGFHTRQVEDDITSVEEQKLSAKVLPVVKEIIDFGLCKGSDGRLRCRDNVDRVHRAVNSIGLGNTEGIRDEKLRLGVLLISDWVLAHQPAIPGKPLFTPKADGLKRMSVTLNALREAGYDKMPTSYAVTRNWTKRNVGPGPSFSG